MGVAMIHFLNGLLATKKLVKIIRDVMCMFHDKTWIIL